MARKWVSGVRPARDEHKGVFAGLAVLGVEIAGDHQAHVGSRPGGTIYVCKGATSSTIAYHHP